MIVMPRVVQTPTSAYSPTPIVYDLIFVHVMEGGCAGSVAWLCSGRVQASVHLCMNEDGTVVYQLVPLNRKAWGQCAFNGRGVSLELPGVTAQGLPDVRWRAAARIVAWLCRAYAIPPVWARGGAGRGVCQHIDLGVAGGGHVDCTGHVGDDVWLRFVGYVKEEYDTLGDGELPAFALNGAPGPHEVVAPPYAAPEPSHGGAARSDPSDVVGHPTVTGYAAHTIQHLQDGLNRLGYRMPSGAPLDVDGGFGPDTEAGLRWLQKRAGIRIDGILGQHSWAALEAALGSQT